MSALRQTLTPTTPPLDPADLHFLRTVASDTEEEDAPWMTMSDRQWRGASALYWSLAVYAQSQTHAAPWYPGAMLPLTYRPPGARRRKQVAPDVFVARVPLEGRDSLPVEEDMPPFVLEVVSASSVRRDLEEKTELYRLLGAQEYAIVRLDLPTPRLEGFRRDGRGRWLRWRPETGGVLWSTVLGLGLVMRGSGGTHPTVRAITREDVLLPTPDEEAAARAREARAREQAELAQERAELAQEQAELAQERAEAALSAEAAARARSEEEVARLRAALEARRR